MPTPGISAVVIASGPSLTEKDVETVRKWGGFTIVVNNSYEIAPWANILYSMDQKWWEIEQPWHFKGELIGPKQVHYAPQKVVHPKVTLLNHPVAGNSGAGGISLAHYLGHKRIAILGCDCKHTDKTHWHGNHKKGLGNCVSVGSFYEQFKKFQHLDVINCSPDSEIDFWPQTSIQNALNTNFCGE